MKVVYFGTPEFAVPPLSALARAGNMRVGLVVSQPDRKAGRGGHIRRPPVAAEADLLGIPVRQPEALRRNPEFAEQLSRESADVFVVAAYGRVFPREILEIPRLGCVNVHASLLPRYRGASPIAAALLAGDVETGISIMKMTEGLDEGPVFAMRSMEIGPDDDAGSLSKRLSEMGADLLVDSLRKLEAGAALPRPQEGEPSFCRPLSRADGKIDWKMSAREIDRRRRAFTPWPGIFTHLDGERIKILAARFAEGAPGAGPGVLVPGASGEPIVACGGGTALVLGEVQREGRRSMSGAEFLRGLPATSIRFE